MEIKDKETCFPRTFNEQMAWIGEEVEHIIKHNATRQTKQSIRQQGREAYGQNGYTHTIKRMFDIIKADPKNRALMREVDRAEQELTAFLYDEPGALPEEEILAYWNNYMWAYIAELESCHEHYFIMRGCDGFHDSDEWIGIYRAWNQARDAYVKAAAQLEEEHRKTADDSTRAHEKIMVHIFDEATGKWSHDVDPELMFKRNVPADTDKHKEIECLIDAPYMFLWILENVRKGLSGYFYDHSPDNGRRNEAKTIPVRFEIEHTYQAFDFLEWYWGDFNACPDCQTMKEKAKQWQESYGAELTRISHDTLTFQCPSLSAEQAGEIIAQAAGLHAEIVDCRPEELVSYMMRERTFTLWWD